MDPKLLTENGWKAIAGKFKVKDNGLQKALAAYEHLEEGKHDERLKAIALVSHLADALKKVKEVATLPDVAKYLANVGVAAESEKSEITKAKLLAAKAQALAQKTAQADAKKQADGEAKQAAEEEEEEGEEEEGDYVTKLTSAIRKLKSPMHLTYQFIVCDTKPLRLCIAKKIYPRHKTELTKLTGSKRFLRLGSQPGTCCFEGGKFVFTVEKPLVGLARKFQESLKSFTGKRYPILVGKESAESDEPDDDQPSAANPAQPAAAAKPAPAAAAAKPVSPELAKGPELWNQTRSNIAANVDRLKAAIRKELAEEEPQVVARVEDMIKTFDSAVQKLDGKLAEALAKVHSANPAERPAALKNAIAALGNQMHAVKAEKLFAHIDANTFGVPTNVEKSLHDCFAQIATALSHK